MDELPCDLAYHIYLMEVMSGCTVGRLNITSIEAKVQSIFGFYDILQVILDPRTILVARISMSLHFYNSVVEVEMRVSGLERSASLWNLLKTYPTIFQKAATDLTEIAIHGWDCASRQEIEYSIICAMITASFFTKYYAPGNTFRSLFFLVPFSLLI